MATPDYYDMKDPMKSQAEAAQADALKSDEGLPVGIPQTAPRTIAEGGMGYLHGGATPSPDTKIPEATKIGAEIVAGELNPPLGFALDTKDLIKAIETGSIAAIATAGFGYLPWLGSAAKGVFKAIRGGDKSAELLAEGRKILTDPDNVAQLNKHLKKREHEAGIQERLEWKTSGEDLSTFLGKRHGDQTGQFELKDLPDWVTPHLDDLAYDYDEAMRRLVPRLEELGKRSVDLENVTDIETLRAARKTPKPAE